MRPIWNHRLITQKELEQSYSQVEDVSPSPANGRVLAFYYANLHTCLSILDNATKLPIYFAAVSDHPLRVPDITLHAGGDKHGPIVGVVHMTFSRHLTLGVGEPGHPEATNSVIW